jgi:hypothetical protein
MGSGTFFPSTTGNTTTVTATAPFAAGATHTFLIVARVNSNTAAGVTASNTASVASNGPNATPDPDMSNNSRTESNTVVVSADVQVTKTGPASVTAGQNITYVAALRAEFVAGQGALPPAAFAQNFAVRAAWPRRMGGRTLPR